MPPLTVLAGKYLLGLARQEKQELRYSALELYLNQRVEVRELYLPMDMMRKEEKNGVFVNRLPGAAVMVREAGKTLRSTAQTLAALRGVPGWPVLADYFEENGTSYAVFPMGDTEAISLRTYMESRESLMTIPEALDLLSPVLTGVGKLHSRDLHHGAISPDTIRIRTQGQAAGQAFLECSWELRAGITEELVDPEPQKQDAYAPLECFSGIDGRGPWTDVYELGAVLYYCVTGRDPASPSARMEQGDCLILPSELGAVITADEEAVLHRALSMNRKERWRNVPAMRDALQGNNTQRQRRNR